MSNKLYWCLLTSFCFRNFEFIKKTTIKLQNLSIKRHKSLRLLHAFYHGYDFNLNDLQTIKHKKSWRFKHKKKKRYGKHQQHQSRHHEQQRRITFVIIIIIWKIIFTTLLHILNQVFFLFPNTRHKYSHDLPI